MSKYLPAGTWEGDPLAPWNQDSPKPIEVKVCVSTTLSKSTTVESDQVFAIMDEDGIEYDYSECNLRKDYEDYEFTIPELLKYLEMYVQAELKQNKTNLSKSSIIEGLSLKTVLKSLKGWTVDELEVIPE